MLYPTCSEEDACGLDGRDVNTLVRGIVSVTRRRYRDKQEHGQGPRDGEDLVHGFVATRECPAGLLFLASEIARQKLVVSAMGRVEDTRDLRRSRAVERPVHAAVAVPGESSRPQQVGS